MSSNELTANKGSMKKSIMNLYSKYGIFLILLVLIIGISLSTDRFLAVKNLVNIVRQISFIAIIGIGGCLVIMTSGIDLSAGSIVGIVSTVSSMLAQNDGYPLIVSLLVGMGTGALCGLINGFLVAKAKIPPFIVTLGMMEVARGVALLITNGRPVGNIISSYVYLGAGNFLSIPVPIIVLFVVAYIMYVLHIKTPFGRHIMALGGNEQAAIISGINVSVVKMKVYAIAGTLAAIAGILMTGRVASGQPNLGIGYEMDGVASAVIGGASLAGGVGSIWGTLAGALVIGVINNGMDLLSVSTYWQQIVKGIIIVGAVYLDNLKHRAKY